MFREDRLLSIKLLRGRLLSAYPDHQTQMLEGLLEILADLDHRKRNDRRTEGSKLKAYKKEENQGRNVENWEVLSNSPLLARVEDKVQRLTLIHQGSSPRLAPLPSSGLDPPESGLHGYEGKR